MISTVVMVPLPLGYLSRSTIQRGYDALYALYEALRARAESPTLVMLSSIFYTVVPHLPTHLEAIDTTIKLGTKVEMLHALTVLLWRQEQEAFSLSRTQQSLVKNYLDECYHTLECHLDPLRDSSLEFALIQRYIINSSCCVGTNTRDTELLYVFRIEKCSESERFAPFRSYANRRILWHGSRLSNWLGILTHGLLISPPGVPQNGNSLGAGLYFTDKISKAMAYSPPSQR
jgi:poly [ADP-ribose] polymerase 1